MTSRSAIAFRWATRPATIALAIGVLLAGCQGKQALPTAPTAPNPPAAGPSFTLVSVEIDGPATIEPGGEVQYKAVGRQVDGSTLDVTASAQWSTLPTGVFSVSGT